MITRTIRVVCGWILSAAVVVFAAPHHVQAVEPAREFLRGLYQRGYGEAAVHYVTQLRARKDLPEEIHSVLDLEMANSLRVAAIETVNADDAAERIVAARACLDKFVSEHAEHPEAAAAFITYGEISLTRGESLLRKAKATTAKVAQEALLVEARGAFEEARPRFARAVELYQARLKGLHAPPEPSAKEPAAQAPPPKLVPKKNLNKKSSTKQVEKAAPIPEIAAGPPTEREQIEELWLEARFRFALVDYQASQTYLDLKSAARKKALTTAAASCDGVYQQFRTARVGLLAHLWHGRIVEELGTLETALDIYDEVLANAPDRGDRRTETELEGLFCEAERSRLMILVKLNQTDDALSEAQDWLKANAAARRTSGYQAIALAHATILLEHAKKMKPEERRKSTQAALTALAEIAKIPSEHQREAILLRRENANQGDTAALRTFNEAMAVADEAAKNGIWEEAIVAYSRAVELRREAKDPEQVVNARYQIARALYLSGKVQESLASAETVVREIPESKMAPQVASLSLAAAWNLYLAAQKDKAAQENVVRTAQVLIDHWPQRSEADDARIALAKLDLMRGDYPAAIKVLEAVNAASVRYPSAQHLAAQTHWRLYLEERKKPTEQRDAQVLAMHRGKVVEQLSVFVAAESKGTAKGVPLPQTLRDAMLLLAEVSLSDGKPDVALKQLEPLLESLKLENAKQLDSGGLRTFVATARAYVALKDLDNAVRVTTLLMDMGDDTPAVNSVLVEFLRLVKTEWQDASASAAANGQPAAKNDPAIAETKARKQRVVDLLQRLSKRENYTMAELVFLGNVCVDLELTDAARQEYQRALQKADADPAARQGNERALTRVRAQLIGLLRQEFKYDEALKEVERLIKDNPNALEPMMEKGNILIALSRMDSKHLDDAIGQWTRIRMLLSRAKQKPPEYYLAIFNAADCLMRQVAATGDKTKAADAEKLLKATLVLNPNLNGPEMVTQYKELLNKSLLAQGRPTQALEARAAK
jgi:hypothetical protein